MTNKPPKDTNYRAFCRRLGIDPRKARLVARIASEQGFSEPPKRLPKKTRDLFLSQVEARGQDRVMDRTPAKEPKPVAKSSDKADKTDLATEKLRKTIAERELLELKALRNRRELLRLFRSKAIAPAMKTVFAPLTEFLRKKLAKTDVKQWNDLVERMDAEFEAALEGAIDGWDD